MRTVGHGGKGTVVGGLVLLLLEEEEEEGVK
jgi:hypothetical protein